jgi:hypothetical protein
MHRGELLDKWEIIKNKASKNEGLSLFNFKKGSNMLKVQLYKDSTINLYLYDQCLTTYEKFTNNNEVPQYFARRIYAKFRENMIPPTFP